VKFEDSLRLYSFPCIVYSKVGRVKAVKDFGRVFRTKLLNSQARMDILGGRLSRCYGIRLATRGSFKFIRGLDSQRIGA